MKRHPMATSPGPAPPAVPWNFVIVTIVVAVAVAAVLAYLGLTGHLGAGIPGAKSPGGGITVVPFVGLAIAASVGITGASAP
jgi:hypothetical protein